ncbi:16830_t:CDS:2 [Funneliformis caledonium]|uniref:16830_t:CDS:1 n=1 Tax=Funneliformis caledonium TaxID=1117310 RepID=A0A9N9HYB5_9GLOM|nr:16830_t:CDS:2 [Funneliformis caledonium]
MRQISSNIKEGAKVICPDLQLENKIKVSTDHMKFAAFPKTNSDTNQDTSDEERISGSETDILSNTDDSGDGEVINVHNVNNV